MVRQNKIEILSVDLLENQRAIVNDFIVLSRNFGNYPIGWHYLLDWSWIFSQMEFRNIGGKEVLDAGAWTGLSQWYLAEQGVKVLSVDRFSRACLPFYFYKRYHIEGLRPNDLLTIKQILNPLDKSASINNKIRAIIRSGRGLFSQIPTGFAPGKVIIYNHDLGSLPDIPENSVDCVVSVSSLEHNAPEKIGSIVDELMRVLKPGGKLFVTLSASKEKDWFHEPSKGWCFTEGTLRKIFKFSPDTSSNYNRYDQLMDKLKDSQELKNNISPLYRFGRKNGLPGGNWNPLYQPVGVIKVK